MKVLMIAGLMILGACTHSQPASTDQSVSEQSPKNEAKEHLKDGWQNVKQGGREVASGVAVGVKKAGTAIHSVACPIAANIHSGRYYAKDHQGYEAMLGADKSDDRECFMSEAAAREKGYQLAK